MSWGKDITPNEPSWVGALIDDALEKRDAHIHAICDENDILRAEVERLRHLVSGAREIMQKATTFGIHWGAFADRDRWLDVAKETDDV